VTESLLKVKNLKVHYPIFGGPLQRRKGSVKAVDGVSFEIFKGETFGLVGESGCGKSTTGRAILRLIQATSGEIWFQGKSIMDASAKHMRGFRKDMQIIFQDPYASLNPRMTVRQILEEPLIVHGIRDARERERRVSELLDVVGLDTYHGSRFPHEFSGGQRQRIGIARSLALRPKLVIADEPVSALDVSVQSQILNLLKDLQEQFELTYLFISHDLSVVRHISDRIGVMYLGKMIEIGEANQIYESPKHPYTKALLSAVPVADPKAKRERIVLTGDVPSPANPPQGCSFHPRCPFATDICRTVTPELKEIGSGHFTACHLFNE
jgi:oligopeptide transport system ATP-binding protein